MKNINYVLIIDLRFRKLINIDEVDQKENACTINIQFCLHTQLSSHNASLDTASEIIFWAEMEGGGGGAVCDNIVEFEKISTDIEKLICIP